MSYTVFYGPNGPLLPSKLAQRPSLWPNWTKNRSESRCIENEPHSTQVRSTMKPLPVSETVELIILIGRAIWLAQIKFVDPIGFWIIFENYSWTKLFILTYSNKIHRLWILLFNVKQRSSQVNRQDRDQLGSEVNRGHFKELWHCQENGIAAVSRIPNYATNY